MAQGCGNHKFYIVFYTTLMQYGDNVVYFTDIKPSEHYLEHHAKDVPWDKVVEIIFKTKNPRKKGTKFEIEDGECYLLFEIKDNVLYVINAKNVR